MIQTLFHRLGFVFLVILLQVFVFNHIILWNYAVPLLGVMVLFRTPLDAGRIGNMLLAFFSGLVLDAFSNTPGVATGALTATAFVQYPLIHAMVPKDAVENAVPDMNLLGRYGYISYIAILMLVHHLMYFLLEAFSFFNAMDLLLRFLGSYALSMLLALSIEMLFSSKRK